MTTHSSIPPAPAPAPSPAAPPGALSGGQQPVTRYHVLFQSLKTRRRRPHQPKGLDSLAAWAALKARSARVSARWLREQAHATDALAKDLRTHSDRALDQVIREIREQFVRGRADDQAVRRALACVRETARRETGEEAYLVQLMGALALYHGRIVEMLTGEGKTLTGSMAAPLLAWSCRRLHIFTVNDYLAARDAQSRAAIYGRCGCAVGAIVQSMDERERFAVYARPIVYGTPKQVTADWLRDQVRMGGLTTPWAGRRLLARQAWMDSAGGVAASGPMVPGLHAALVDEADAVLIDEGVVPLIIARARTEDQMAPVYRQAADAARRLDEHADFTIDHLRKKAELTRRGVHRCGQLTAGLDEPIWRAARRGQELIRQALVAAACYKRGQQYEIVDGRIVIVDEYTGRFLADRSWEHGLHQAVEAKEGLEVTADRETLARMSFQRFFRMYPRLCGMTGTAADAAIEMERVYQRAVTVIPTNRPLIRRQWPARVFRTGEARWDAVLESILELHKEGRPVLVGTRSIEASELVARRLEARALPHRVLNANFDKDEADLIALAGRRGTITVATNMAGRGTDIKPDAESLERGGLHVILTEMHTAKRIDRQFIGRTGRQGDPGSAQVFASLDDELPRLHAPRLCALAGSMNIAGTGDELSGPARRLALRALRLAQRAAEARARRNRAEVLRQDDWIDKHMPGQ